MSKFAVDDSNRSGSNASEHFFLIYSSLFPPPRHRKLHKRTPTSALSTHTVGQSVMLSRRAWPKCIAVRACFVRLVLPQSILSIFLLTFFYPCPASGGIGRPKILIMLSCTPYLWFTSAKR